ncbi:hypothetical protein [Enterobacillus tribolii]|nr:hypothetical protein [Enterobacillus tribolii]
MSLTVFVCVLFAPPEMPEGISGVPGPHRAGGNGRQDTMPFSR